MHLYDDTSSGNLIDNSWNHLIILTTDHATFSSSLLNDSANLSKSVCHSVSDRPDAAQANLRSAAYEALMEMVKNSPKDCYVTVQKTIMVILERLQQVLQMEARIVSQSDRVQYNDLQSLLCATLQVLSTKVTIQIPD